MIKIDGQKVTISSEEGTPQTVVKVYMNSLQLKESTDIYIYNNDHIGKAPNGIKDLPMVEILFNNTESIDVVIKGLLKIKKYFE